MLETRPADRADPDRAGRRRHRALVDDAEVPDRAAAHGAPLIGGIAIDVTPRMRAELALRASEDRYRSLVELAGSVIVVVDADGRIIEFNRAAEAFFGLARGRRDRSRATCERCVSEPQRDAGRAPTLRASATASRCTSASPTCRQRDGTHKFVPLERHAPRDADEREPRAPGHRPGHLRAAAPRDAAAAVAAHGGHRPAGRRHRARLQQPADGDPRPRRDGAGRTSAPGRSGARQHRRDHARRAARGRPHAPAAGIRAAPDHRAAHRRSERAGAQRRPHAAPAARRGRRARHGAGPGALARAHRSRASSSRCWSTWRSTRATRCRRAARW